jgi:hypothetical protein
MSNDRLLYVGPYYACRCALITREVEGAPVCPNAQCPNYQKSRYHNGEYCNRCGTRRIGTTRVVQEPAVDYTTVAEDLHERITRPLGDGYYYHALKGFDHIWIANIAVVGVARDFGIDPDDFSVLSITESARFNEVAAFDAQFTAEREVLHRHYGEANVSVGWGIIQHYS